MCHFGIHYTAIWRPASTRPEGANFELWCTVRAKLVLHSSPLAGATGDTGATGPAGPNKLYVGATAPADTSLVWVDTSA